jgi:hypothetical protein
MKTEKQLKINGYPEKNTGTLDFVSTGIQWNHLHSSGLPNLFL